METGVDRGGRTRRGLVLALVAMLSAVIAVPATADERYATTIREELHPGVVWTSLQAAEPLSIHVAEVDPGAPVRLVPVISDGELLDDPPSRRHAPTTDMCESVGGVVCVNADYWVCPTCGPPGGGVVVDGVPLRTPTILHPQVTVLDDGSFVADELRIAVRLEATFAPEEPDITDVLDEPEPPRVETIEIAEINRPVGDGIVLYSPTWADRTQRGEDADEAVFGGAVPAIGSSSAAGIWSVGGHDRAIPDEGFVLAATGAARDGFLDRMEGLREADALTVYVTANMPATMSIGGHPVILRDGEHVALEQRDPKVRNRHPRTILGWNDARDLWLVTIDGRQRGHSVGVTLAEAADHLRALGATDAMNLDGGGSSTFVTAAACPSGETPCIRNRPSDGRERHLSTALALVPTDGTTVDRAVLPPPPPPPPPTIPPPTTVPPPATTTTEPPPTTSPTTAPTTTAVVTTTVPTTFPPPTTSPTTVPELASGSVVIDSDDGPARTGPAAAAAGMLVVVAYFTRREWMRSGPRTASMVRTISSSPGSYPSDVSTTNTGRGSSRV